MKILEGAKRKMTVQISILQEPVRHSANLGLAPFMMDVSTDIPKQSVGNGRIVGTVVKVPNVGTDILLNRTSTLMIIFYPTIPLHSPRYGIKKSTISPASREKVPMAG